MAAKKADERQAREARKRLHNYQVRTALHDKQVARRKRDNWIAVAVTVAVLAVAVAAELFYFSGGPGTPAPIPSESSSPSATPGATSDASSAEVPADTVAEDRDWTGTMTINADPVTFTLDGSAAPQAVSSFVSLAEEGFYDGLSCHRLTTSGIYVLQCGDPNGDGSGGPGYSYGPIENAPEDDVYPAGTIAMARQSNVADSMGSQFFIVYEDTTIPSDTAGGYTVLGRVTDGLDAIKTDIIDKGVAADATTAGDGAPAVVTTIESITVK